MRRDATATRNNYMPVRPTVVSIRDLSPHMPRVLAQLCVPPALMRDYRAPEKDSDSAHDGDPEKGEKRFEYERRERATGLIPFRKYVRLWQPDL